MEMPQELEVWYVLPAIRRELTKGLLKVGLKKSQIAKKLNITKSAVSQYLKEKRGNEFIFNKKINMELKEAIKNLISNKTTPLFEIQRICNLVKTEHILCKFHKTKNPSLKNCEVCHERILR